MKNILLIISTLLLLYGCANKNTFTVKGKIEGIEDGQIYILGPDDKRIVESTIKNGDFFLKGAFEKYEKYGKYVLRTDKTWIAQLFFEPGSNLNVVGKTSEGMGDPKVKISGNAIHDNMIVYYDEMSELYEGFDKLTERRDKEKIYNKVTQLSERYFEKNMDNLFGINRLQYLTHFKTPTEIMAMINKMPEEVQQTDEVQKIQKNTEKFLVTEPGRQYIDINLPDKDGNNISVSSLLGSGKYVLIDFWSTSCGPCMEEMPYLKEAYNRYRNKGFEIYGISLDTDRDKWLSVIEEKEMNWLHVCSFKMWKDEFVKKYIVHKIPANFLVDPNGTIIGKNLRGEEVERTLSQHIK